jgi:hypothetical protein
MKNLISKHSLFILLITFNILFAVFFGSDFGDSADENTRYNFALESIARYSNLEPNPRIGDQGPIYFVLAKIGGDLIRLINPSLSNIQAWHYSHFLSFILATIAFYSICLHFLSPQLAFVTSALFNTQPLLFGHAFINPKDIPFMSLFLLTISSGLMMVSKIKDKNGNIHGSDFFPALSRSIRQDWLNLKQFPKIFTFLSTLINLFVILLLIIFADQVQLKIQSMINKLNDGWVYNIINRLAQTLFNGDIRNGISLQNTKTVYPYLMIFLIIIVLLFILGLSIYYFPKSIGTLSGFSSRNGLRSDFSIIMRNKWVYLSGLILGISITNRSLGLAAGLYILFYLWVKNRSKFISTSIIYLGISLLVVYLSWPGIWGNPIIGIFKSFLGVSTFSWGGKVLFFGETLSPNNLPAMYIPTLMSIQLTIPALILFIVGVTVSLVKRYRNELDKTLFFIAGTWLFLPLMMIFIVKPSIYDNFRHFLFLTPPVFLFAGLGIKYVYSMINKKIISFLLTFAILLPGIIGIINLHPYQYIYYNSLIGGVEGAFRKFETDYWYTSYYESTKYINEVSSKNDTILVYGSWQIVDYYAREDLNIIKYNKDDEQTQFKESDYAIISTRGNKDLSLYPDEQTIFTIEKSGATLAVVRKLK